MVIKLKRKKLVNGEKIGGYNNIVDKKMDLNPTKKRGVYEIERDLFLKDQRARYWEKWHIIPPMRYIAESSEEEIWDLFNKDMAVKT